jgi:two-component system, chemotaxis family, chemotaxis protein CheY
MLRYEQPDGMLRAMPPGDARCIVFVIDDNVDAREVAEVLLGVHGYASLLAENGRDALEKLGAAAQRPCCILLDLTMPVMDGWTFHRHLLADARFRDIPVIVTTASTMPPPEDVALVLFKPIEPNRMLAAVRRFCPGGHAPE